MKNLVLNCRFLSLHIYKITILGPFSFLKRAHMRAGVFARFLKTGHLLRNLALAPEDATRPFYSPPASYTGDGNGLPAVPPNSKGA